MKVAISQPEHFPYIGYFQKMCACDLFVVLDHVQFSGPRSYQNRNRFQSFGGQQEWFTVPVRSGSYGLPIPEVMASSDPTWRSKLVRKLQLRFKEDFTEVYEPQSLLEINLRSIEYLRNRFKIDTPLLFSSALSSRTSKSRLLIDLCLEVGGSTYVCGSGGRAYLDEELFKLAGVGVDYFQPKVPHPFTSLQEKSFTF
jgi:hypothetical protein